MSPKPPTKWTDRASDAFAQLTSSNAKPKVVRLRDGGEASNGERPSDKLLRIAESSGWDIHSDPDLVDFLSTVDVAENVPRKLNDLIAEVLLFCWELDGEGSVGEEPADGSSQTVR